MKTFTKLSVLVAMCLPFVSHADSFVTETNSDWNMVAMVPSRGLAFWQHKNFAISGGDAEIRHTSELVNMTTARNGALSYVNNTRYDCRKGTYLIVDQTWYTDWFGKGKALQKFDNRNGEPIPIPSGSPAEKSAHHVCNMKGA